MKKTQIFPRWVFCLFAVADIFLEVVLFQEIYSVLKTPDCMSGRPLWLVDKGNFWVLNDLEYRLFQLFHTLKSLYLKAYFSFT